MSTNRNIQFLKGYIPCKSIDNMKTLDLVVGDIVHIANNYTFYVIEDETSVEAIPLPNSLFAKPIPNPIAPTSPDSYTVDTIEKLKELRFLKEGNIVEVLGYYQAGDGAGHQRIIASTDDGSGVQLDNQLWANIVHNGEVNVSWFGAKGDGVTDDGDIIQKAINYCNIVKLDNNKVYATTKTIKVGIRQKTLTSSESVERGMTKIKYTGTLNQKGTVVIVGTNDVGKFDVDATADVLSNIQIDANNLCGIGVYCTYATNETRIENVVTYNTLEYGMYFGKSWYATFRNLTAKSSKGNGIALGMELRFSDGSVIKPADNEHIIQLNGVFIDGIRTSACGKKAESQDYKYGYGVGVGKGNCLNVTNIVSENCGIGILVERTYGNAFNVSNFYCESNTKGFILDTRNPLEESSLFGAVKNGFISGEIEHINGENTKNSTGGIVVSGVCSTVRNNFENLGIISIENCNYNVNGYIQPIPTDIVTGIVLNSANDKDLRYTLEMLIPAIKSYQLMLYIVSNQEYDNVSASFSCFGADGGALGSFSIPTTLKKGVSYIRQLPSGTVKVKSGRVANSPTVVDVIITTVKTQNY